MKIDLEKAWGGESEQVFYDIISLLEDSVSPGATHLVYDFLHDADENDGMIVNKKKNTYYFIWKDDGFDEADTENTLTLNDDDIHVCQIDTELKTASIDGKSLEFTRPDRFFEYLSESKAKGWKLWKNRIKVLQPCNKSVYENNMALCNTIVEEMSKLEMDDKTRNRFNRQKERIDSAESVTSIFESGTFSMLYKVKYDTLYVYFTPFRDEKAKIGDNLILPATPQFIENVKTILLQHGVNIDE